MSTYKRQNILHYIDSLLYFSNYSKAAEFLNISQPYLTQVIKRIENELNCQIINRSKLPYRLTEPGKIYYDYLSSLEAVYVNMRRKITTITDTDKTAIKIGILASIGTYLIPLFLPKFLAIYPECQIELVEDIPGNNEQRLLKSEVDFWIGQNSSSIAPALCAVSWGKHRYYAVIPRSCELYQKDTATIAQGSIAMEDLLRQRLVLTSKGSAIRMQVDHLLGIYKIKANIILESSEIDTVKNLAMADVGLTFVPESLALEPCPAKYNIYELPIDQLNLDYFIAHSRKRGLSAIDKGLLDAFLRYKDTEQYSYYHEEKNK
ncbi:LysR family transcriptional regulator [Citrobacter amalonaticus Y19]|uniref:LysR family transcriptional regulator n=1 Tax=Citrobacter amalonaticus Y19 TaxID=1261127 RepID=A0A0F6TVX7_CITAM|nr:LysR family transcriptional regulator [Citrobacter amalonaticus]AKE59411.1 LysR family transcriptional regulator [Citrobacter amalonaticus Y19]